MKRIPKHLFLKRKVSIMDPWMTNFNNCSNFWGNDLC